MGAQLTLALITFVAGALVMAIVAWLAYGAMLPRDVLGVLIALVVGTTAFAVVAGAASLWLFRWD